MSLQKKTPRPLGSFRCQTLVDICKDTPLDKAHEIIFFAPLNHPGEDLTIVVKIRIVVAHGVHPRSRRALPRAPAAGGRAG